MAAGTWTWVAGNKVKLFDGTFGAITGSNAYKIALFNNSWAVTTTIYSTTNEISQAYGYLTGGVQVTLTAVETTGTVKVTTATAVSWTASGGTITARYAVLYKATSTFDIMCYCLLDSAPADVATTTGNALTLTMNASGIYTLS